MDSHGLATWITVQEGLVGLPNKKRRNGWPIRVTILAAGGDMFLRPGQTVFFNSCTIHFVFRSCDKQILALGGHTNPVVSLRSE